MSKTKPLAGGGVSVIPVFGFWILNIVSDFVLRIEDARATKLDSPLG